MQGHVQTKFLFDDRHQHVDADGDPDLRPHGVFGSAVEAFDAQVLRTVALKPQQKTGSVNLTGRKVSRATDEPSAATSPWV